MNHTANQDRSTLTGRALAGDRKALEELLLSVRDPVFNLSLRMLGSFADAEDATQDILLKVITHLASFQQESAFSTWVFRIAVNHLRDYKKHMFAHHPLSFEFYAEDIRHAPIRDLPDLTQGVDQALLAEELKLCCTNVMLQCLSPENRCIFILGTMFQLDSRLAGEILGLTPEAYRQRLSRSRKKMAAFLEAYCGAYGQGGCRCRDRLNYAIQSQRLDPKRLDYTSAAEIPAQTMLDVKEAMESVDDLSLRFSFCKTYESPERTRRFIKELLASPQLAAIRNPGREDCL